MVFLYHMFIVLYFNGYRFSSGGTFESMELPSSSRSLSITSDLSSVEMTTNQTEVRMVTGSKVRNISVLSVILNLILNHLH